MRRVPVLPTDERIPGGGRSAKDQTANVTVSLDDIGSRVEMNSPVPYYHQLVTVIENKINSGDWLPGQFLPSEQELCEHFRVSRTVVRQAMLNLVQKGLVAKRTGKRTMISVPSYEGTLMQSLKGFYEDAVSRGQRPYSRVLDLRTVPANPEVAGALQLKEGDTVFLLNRLRFLDGVPEVSVLTYLPARLCPALAGEDFTNQSLYTVLARKYGLTIARGLRSIEAIALSKQQAESLQVPPGSPALLLKSIGTLADGTPLEYYIAVHRGDRAKFQVQLVREQKVAGSQFG